MIRRRNQEDLLNPHRTLNRLIKDYIDGHLTNNRLFYRARVEAVDVDGGQLESMPPNPPKSIRARVYTSGLDATTPDEALTIFYPFHPQNSCPPVQVGEHVYVAFEDAQMTNGLWFITIPSVFSNLNYSNPDEVDREAAQLSAADRFNERPASARHTNIHRQYGGESFSSANQQRILTLVSQNHDSVFKNKRILVIGDSHLNTSLNPALQSALLQKGAASYQSVGRIKATTLKWLNSHAEGQPTLPELVSQFGSEVVIIILGTWDSFNIETYESDFTSLIESIPNAKVICVGPPKISGRYKQRFDARGIDRNAQLRQIEAVQTRVVGLDNFVSLYVISGDSSLTTDGVLVNQEGARIWASKISTR